MLAPALFLFLALLAACPTAEGLVLELGSYCGKSAIVLAMGAALADRARIVTVDPRSDRATGESRTRVCMCKLLGKCMQQRSTIHILDGRS